MKIFIFLIIIFVPLQTVWAGEKSTAPVLAELFSSENCPACPPADEYMKTLSETKGVIALSCHIDYFGPTQANLGREFCTDRQDFYINNMGRDKYFTPHMVINGHMNEIGYETAKISALLVQGQGDKVDAIKIQSKADGVYEFNLAPRVIKRSAKIFLAVYNKPMNVNERGRNTTYYNVVKRVIPMGQWNGRQLSRAIFPILDKQSAGFAVVAQDSQDGKVLAIGEYKL